MKIIRAYPPIYSTLVTHFPIKGKQNILYAWGDTIFNPSGHPVPQWLHDHEAVHGQRQLAIAAAAPFSAPIYRWWDQYIMDTQFRLSEEILAHRAEWKSFVKHNLTLGKQEDYLRGMVERLSGPLYGKVISPKAALQEITQ